MFAPFLMRDFKVRHNNDDGGNIIDVLFPVSHTNIFHHIAYAHFSVWFLFARSHKESIASFVPCLCSSHFHSFYYIIFMIMWLPDCVCVIAGLCMCLWWHYDSFYIIWFGYFTCKYPVMRVSNQPLHIILCDDNFVWLFLFCSLSLASISIAHFSS